MGYVNGEISAGVIIKQSYVSFIITEAEISKE